MVLWGRILMRFCLFHRYKRGIGLLYQMRAFYDVKGRVGLVDFLLVGGRGVLFM